MSVKIAVVSVLFLAFPALAAAQDRATVLVLDGSGSMWAALPEGRSRIEVARDVLGDFLAARDPSQPLGVIAYGHNRRGDCSDIETVAPVAVQDGPALGARLRALMPRGKTPLADALRHAAAQIPPQAEEADIVLITDGLETCGGDPCAVAAELAAGGVPLRAHVVGFGLTEGEVRQIACVAEQTGGLVLATQSGAELSAALLRTAAAPKTPALPGTAALHLSIRADIAGRPDRVRFHATDLNSGESRALGQLDFTLAQHLTVELPEGRWQITAEAGEEGHGETTAEIVAGQNNTIYVPFRGLLPSLEMPAPAGAFRAGINGLLPYRIPQEGLATGGGDFVLSVLPADAATTADRRIDYATQESRLGAYVGTFRTPAEPGRYLLVFHRNADMPVDQAMARFEIVVEARPEMRLVAPPAVAPGARVPVTLIGGMGQSDRVEIWRDGALYSWDQSLYVQDMFDNAYGPAKPLLAPSEPGEYELVYVFSEIDGEAAVAARQPLSVGTVADPDAASAPEAPTAPAVAPADAPPTTTPAPEAGAVQKTEAPASAAPEAPPTAAPGTAGAVAEGVAAGGYACPD
ncbi:MAG: VWA domain-containing protein, partial [Sphingomonadales bacterium]|nr:VWA domain-containing protein [Sphingomonadales bacterium]